MQTINALLPVLYIINLTLCAASFTLIVGALSFKTLKTIKSFLF